ALYVQGDMLTIANRIAINTWALGVRLPTMHAFREDVQAGGLMSYGAKRARLIPARGRLCRQNSARGETGRHPGRAANQIRSRNQFNDRQGAGPYRAG